MPRKRRLSAKSPQTESSTRTVSRRDLRTYSTKVRLFKVSYGYGKRKPITLSKPSQKFLSVGSRSSILATEYPADQQPVYSFNALSTTFMSTRTVPSTLRLLRKYSTSWPPGKREARVVSRLSRSSGSRTILPRTSFSASTMNGGWTLTPSTRLQRKWKVPVGCRFRRRWKHRLFLDDCSSLQRQAGLDGYVENSQLVFESCPSHQVLTKRFLSHRRFRRFLARSQHLRHQLTLSTRSYPYHCVFDQGREEGKETVAKELESKTKREILDMLTTRAVRTATPTSVA